MGDALQEAADRIYARNGPCCAGCDWWKGGTTTSGRCTKAAPVSGHEVMLSMGITWSSYKFTAGHPFTDADNSCGDFKDEFDWASLPLAYLRKIGGLHLAKGGEG